MKRLGLVLATLTVTLGLLNVHPAVAADTDNFTIKSFEADYYLSRDDKKNSQLRVEEKLVAEFPGFDQNHGILRAIPKTYKDHPLNLKVEKVTNEFGEPINYTSSTSNDNEILKIGDADKYVHGRQTYKIYYSLQHVTSNFDDHDEFYWDINGDQWRQTFDEVTVRLHIAKELVDSIAPGETCFVGAYGSTGKECSITSYDAEDGRRVITSFAGRQLQAGETLTIVAAFKKDTFAAYKPDPMAVMWQWLATVGQYVVLPLIALIVISRNWLKYGRDPKGRGTIVPEYLPPKEVSVMASSAVLKEGFTPAALPAQIVDLAVRGFLKIYEVKEDRKLLPDKTTYEVELTQQPAKLRFEEREVIRLLFGYSPKLGERVSFKDLAHKRYREAKSLGKRVDKQLVLDGYFRTEPQNAKFPYIAAGGIMAGIGFVGGLWGLLIAGIIVLIGANFMPARTKKGVALREYLEGLRTYMKLAEAERIKVLQSPHGTLTEKIDTGNNAQLIKLYEKLLPFAVLFGIEKDWAKAFAALSQEPPSWYSGSSTFNAVWFASSLHSFGAASAASFTSPNSSSSSGVGGGGFSGGGGGGGGGGGW